MDVDVKIRARVQSHERYGEGDPVVPLDELLASPFSQPETEETEYDGS